MSKCPECGRPDPEDIEELRESCAIRGIQVGDDDAVSRKDAARLIHRSPYTLRNWALAGNTDLEFRKYSGHIAIP